MRAHWILALGALVCLGRASVCAQTRGDTASRWTTVPLAYMGTVAEDRARLDQLRGASSTSGWLLRSTFSAVPSLDSAASTRPFLQCVPRWAFVSPQASLTWNSGLPFERNDGGVWSGRGLTSYLAGGVLVHCGRIRGILV